jgi:hypothetical protein
MRKYKAQKMYDEHTNAIAAYTHELREFLSQYTMVSIAQYAANEFWNLLQQGFGGVDMHSPYRQICHLLGLALTSKEHIGASSITEEPWRKAKELSTKIFQQYCMMYFQPPAESEALLDDELRRNEVTMCMFLQYLGAPPMRSEDQWQAQLKALYVPFDDVLRGELGFSASDFLHLVGFVRESHLKQFNHSLTAYRHATECHKNFVADWDAKGWSIEQIRDEIERHPIGSAMREFAEKSQNLWLLKRADLDREIDADIVTNMLARLGTSRGLDADDYKYATDPSPAIRHPLIKLGEDIWFCATHSLFYQAAELHFETALTRGRMAQRFLEARDLWVEERVASALRNFLGENGHVWQSVCETQNGQLEHDVVAKIGEKWLVAEVKAAPVRRGFFDPNRAFVRIRDDFHSDRGIQKAYEQGERLRKLLLEADKPRFFSADGKVIIDLNIRPEEVFVICVTGEFWGSVQIDLSLLLKKADGDPFPWSVCIDDLEAFLGALKTRGKSANDLFKFLRQRSILHGRSFSEDELNIGGYFLEHGALPPPSDDSKTHCLFTPENSTVFDEIFLEEHGTPFKRDRQQELQKYLHGMQDFTDQVSTRLFGDGLKSNTSIVPGQSHSKVGRNDPCPCGSGRKFKKCHGA